MKKKYLSVAVVLALAASMLSTSCIGSFALTNKLLTWNKTISNKFVNELVFFAFWIIPVYEVSAFADVVVFNSIEFWSGNNPVAYGKKVIDGQDGKYIVECDKTGYTITSENDGSIVRLDFNDSDRSWSVSANGSESYKLMTFIDDTHVEMIAPDGTMQPVELSHDGVLAYQNIAAGTTFARR
ncbi:DUF3332 domain-containing protein [Barnesiella sp. WM24]|uniref:DUF3332 domain-containing protein n=1 Tax=Barnesiella sp. WM24 TaxID=2558278 RepID=UPI0010720B72|nr:DUF3332 domain-containing protein [Barnesiella sp. WM24]MDE6114001.1 DUF3332 domain-containing protein [Muribaculum sp.]TFU92636.1 DUF3332 domain-containing protein [Barnesiella sp. WM24]